MDLKQASRGELVRRNTERGRGLKPWGGVPNLPLLPETATSALGGDLKRGVGGVDKGVDSLEILI